MLQFLIIIIVLCNLILGLEGIRHLIVKVAAEMKAKQLLQSEDIPNTVYSLCALHGCRNAKITDSNMQSLVVQWAKCGNEEDVALKEQQMKSARKPITASSFSQLKEMKNNVTFVGLNLTQKLETNFEVVTSNLAEQGNNKIKVIRSSPIVETHIYFLRNTATTFTERHTKAQSYLSIQRLIIVPDALKKTVAGAEYLKQRCWQVYIQRIYSADGRPGSAYSVDFVCFNPTGTTTQCYEVTLTCSETKPWYENILCRCNRTRQYGRPCFHASLCLLSPPVSDPNMISRDPQLFDYARPIWYSDKFLVSTMIRQYSSRVKIPSFKELTRYRVFPPVIYKLPGLQI